MKTEQENEIQNVELMTNQYAPPLALQSSAGSISSDQLSQIALYLGQNLDITGASSNSDFTVMSVTSEGSTVWIFDSGVTHHMTFDHSILTLFSCF